MLGPHWNRVAEGERKGSTSRSVQSWVVQRDYTRITDCTLPPSVTVTGLDSTRASASSVGGRDSPNKAAVKSGDVFLPTRSSLIDKLASTASSASSYAGPSLSETAIGQKATTAVTSALSTAQTSISSRVPSILQTGSSTGSAKDAPAAPPTMKAEDVPQVVGSEVKIARWVPGSLRETVFGIDPEYRIGRCVPRVKEVVCAVQGAAFSSCGLHSCSLLTESSCEYSVEQSNVRVADRGPVRSRSTGHSENPRGFRSIPERARIAREGVRNGCARQAGRRRARALAPSRA